MAPSPTGQPRAGGGCERGAVSRGRAWGSLPPPHSASRTPQAEPQPPFAWGEAQRHCGARSQGRGRVLPGRGRGALGQTSASNRGWEGGPGSRLRSRAPRVSPARPPLVLRVPAPSVRLDRNLASLTLFLKCTFFNEHTKASPPSVAVSKTRRQILYCF